MELRRGIFDVYKKVTHMHGMNIVDFERSI